MYVHTNGIDTQFLPPIHASSQVSTREISHGHPSSQETMMVRTFSEIASRKGAGESYDKDRRQWAHYLLATQKVLNAALDSARGGGGWVSL